VFKSVLKIGKVYGRATKVEKSIKFLKILARTYYELCQKLRKYEKMGQCQKLKKYEIVG